MSKPGDKDNLSKAAESAAVVASDSHGSVRETLESILIAFVLAFIFRAFVVEAFVIPTGSMAPTLLGQHVQMDCPECGYRFTMGPRDKQQKTQADLSTQGSRNYPIEEACPMCRYPIFKESLPLNAGDRILVLKYVYTIFEPTRWDVVVFKNPTNPDENYIKRLVGLPNEQLLIAGGDVFTRKIDSTDDSEWKIQSKPDFVQRTVWQPVYHSNYYPLDGGATAPNKRVRRWKMPWRMTGGEGVWKHEKTGPRFVYDASQKSTGELAFDTSMVHPVGREHRLSPIDPTLNFYEYNMFPTGAEEGIGHNPFRDMRIAATVAPAAEGLRITLTASDFENVYRAVIEPDGSASIQSAERPDNSRGPLESLAWKDEAKAIDPVRLPVGAGTRLELWSVDGELSLFVNESRVQLTTGDRVKVARKPTEAPRASRANEPIARVGVSGASATLRAVDLDRDLYYTDNGAIGVKGRPAVIKPGHYYCLGDNSPQSQDGRLWNSVDQWVMEMMEGKDELHELKGYVPADLMIGRAFFVYFPAGHRVIDGSPGVLPNFGEMRFIH